MPEVYEITSVVLEALWERGIDDLCGLLVFVVIHSDIVPGNRDYHKFNVVSGDVVCWQMYYYLCLYVLWGEHQFHVVPNERWTWPNPENLPKKGNQQV